VTTLAARHNPSAQVPRVVGTGQSLPVAIGSRRRRPAAPPGDRSHGEVCRCGAPARAACGAAVALAALYFGGAPLLRFVKAVSEAGPF
jgi:hypothetical protein